MVIVLFFVIIIIIIISSSSSSSSSSIDTSWCKIHTHEKKTNTLHILIKPSLLFSYIFQPYKAINKDIT
jgi:hypothetical protein